MIDGSTSQFVETYLVNEKVDLVYTGDLKPSFYCQRAAAKGSYTSSRFLYKNKFNLENCASIWSPYFA